MDIEEISRQYFPKIHRAALVLSGNPWDADDLAQETFLVLARGGSQFRGQSKLFTWLYGILLNLDRRERRRFGARRRKLAVVREMELARDAAVAPADAAVEVAEWKHSLWSVVARLPDGQRQSLVLRFSEGLAYHEIAEAMQCPLGTVKSRIYHGLVALRRLLESAECPFSELPDYPNEDLHRAV